MLKVQRFAVGYLAGKSEKHQARVRKLMEKNDRMVPPTAEEKEQHRPWALWEHLEYKKIELPAARSFIQNRPMRFDVAGTFVKNLKDISRTRHAVGK